MKNILVVSVHPDDEAIGAGGTILKHAANNDKIIWLIVTGMKSDYGYTSEEIDIRSNEIEIVKSLLGFSKIIQLNMRPAGLSDESLPHLISKISEIIRDEIIEIVYTVNRSDAHSDHKITSQAVMASTKSFRQPNVKKVLMYECISETEFNSFPTDNPFIPNYYVDISEYLREKIKICEVYKSEFHEHPFPRSPKNIEALATYRGAMAGVEYAEAFQLVKFIDK
ncbi:MAG: PIG-L family deacetylase [Bacteroidetes bacterium]|nr:PIG-L family deacetylase [Bacteroidota bacterium]